MRLLDPMAYASNEVSDEPVQVRSLVRAFAAHKHDGRKQSNI